jgi:hypothetical protein
MALGARKGTVTRKGCSGGIESSKRIVRLGVRYLRRSFVRICKHSRAFMCAITVE